MANDTAYIAEFADNLWNNYIKQKVSDLLQNGVSYYKATVISNPGDGTLNVQRPFDNTINISCANDLRGVSAGTLVTVLVFGNGNAKNHIAVSKNGMKDIRSKTIADYVAASGVTTSGVDTTILISGSSKCYWQQWESGKLEIWGESQLADDLQTNTALSSGGYISAPLTCWGTWPVAFVGENPLIKYSLVVDEQMSGANYFTAIDKFALTNGGTAVNAKTRSPYFAAWSEVQDEFYYGGDYPKISFYAVGRWK